MSPPNLKPDELLQKLADFFDQEKIRYRVVGSMASMAYSEYRFTNDVDVLVDLRPDQIPALLRDFGEDDFYFSQEAALEAIRTRRQFNIIHMDSGVKADIIIPADTEFGRAEMAGGKFLAEGINRAWFATPEHVILSKLLYYQEGGSEKHLRDIAGILLVQGNAVDWKYISEWAVKLGVVTEWDVVFKRVGPLLA